MGAVAILGSRRIVIKMITSRCWATLASLRACRKFSDVNAALSAPRQEAAPQTDAMILNAFAANFKLRAKDDFKSRHFEAPLIVQAVPGADAAQSIPAWARQNPNSPTGSPTAQDNLADSRT